MKSEDKPILSARQKRVYDLLCSGKHSVTDITIALGYGDPRSYVRALREKGINIYDQWIENNEVRYKVYWIEEKQPKINIQDNHTVGETTQSDFKNLFQRNHYD